jgi:selenocysteine insertion sequence-binding protein 2
VNSEIDSVCAALLQEICRFQDRLYHKNPSKVGERATEKTWFQTFSPKKAKTKRRFVMGIREVTKHLKLQRIKCIILAPNCEKIQSKGTKTFP